MHYFRIQYFHIKNKTLINPFNKVYLKIEYSFLGLFLLFLKYTPFKNLHNKFLRHTSATLKWSYELHIKNIDKYLQLQDSAERSFCYIQFKLSKQRSTFWKISVE